MTMRLIQGDCREVLKTLPDASIDCCVTDPPYGETSLAWDISVGGWLSEVRRVLKPTASLWVFGSMRMFVGMAFPGWKLAQDVVWEKHNGTGLFNDRFRRVHEHALQFYRDDAKWSDVFKEPQFTMDATARTVRKKAKPAHWIGAVGPTSYTSEDGGPRLQRSVIYARSEHGRAIHPTQKPVEIVGPLVLYSCPPGGTVLDCFAGSGTTGLVAQQSGRNAVLIEVNAGYAALARKRLGLPSTLQDRLADLSRAVEDLTQALTR